MFKVWITIFLIASSALQACSRKVYVCGLGSGTLIFTPPPKEPNDTKDPNDTLPITVSRQPTPLPLPSIKK
jgi:hypothetical protein